jgi:hypothetical protein
MFEPRQIFFYYPFSFFLSPITAGLSQKERGSLPPTVTKTADFNPVRIDRSARRYLGARNCQSLFAVDA